MPVKQVAIAIDQLANTLLGGFADEAITAARLAKWQDKQTVGFGADRD